MKTSFPPQEPPPTPPTPAAAAAAAARALDWSALQCFMRQTRTQHFAPDPSLPFRQARRTTAAKENMKKQTEAVVEAGVAAGANNT